jgi:hypothetical protein
MSKLWVSLKRDRVYADIFYMGKKIATISVNEGNRSNTSVVDIESDSEVSIKIVKKEVQEVVIDEDSFNKEEYNR